MPRFPVLPQRVSVPAAFSNRPRAQAAHFGAGIGRNLASLGSEAAELGQVIEHRQGRQVKQQMSQFDLELAKQRAESDIQAPPEEASDAQIERHQSIFDTSAEKLLQGYQGKVCRDDYGKISSCGERPGTGSSSQVRCSCAWAKGCRMPAGSSSIGQGAWLSMQMSLLQRP